MSKTEFKTNESGSFSGNFIAYFDNSIDRVCSKYFYNQHFKHQRHQQKQKRQRMLVSTNKLNSNNSTTTFHQTYKYIYNNYNDYHSATSNNNNISRKLRLRITKRAFTFDKEVVTNGNYRFRAFRQVLDKLLYHKNSHSEIEYKYRKKKIIMNNQRQSLIGKGNQLNQKQDNNNMNVNMNITEYIRILNDIDRRMKVYGYSLNNYPYMNSNRKDTTTAIKNPLAPWFLMTSFSAPSRDFKL